MPMIVGAGADGDSKAVQRKAILGGTKVNALPPPIVQHRVSLAGLFWRTGLSVCDTASAQTAGLLKPQALANLLKDAMRRHAAQTLLAGAVRATAAGSKPLSMDEIQAEVDAVRKARRGRRPAAA
ncbi:MAG: hypothetical protein IPI44_04230 [Sulfuritalea sp.]|nr:hypothetical protein [Sulfuritalea sp.]